MWQEQFGEALDGVIATDPVALSHILAATGPADLPGGGTITAENAVELTMKKVYDRYPTVDENTVRDDYLEGISRSVFGKLLSGSGDPKALAEQLGDAAGEHRLLVYSTHADDQRRLEQTPLAGAVPRGNGPFAGVVVNNYSGNKLDYYLDRKLVYDRSSCASADERVESRITVTLTNNAPITGLPPYVDDRLDPENFRGERARGGSTSLVQVFATEGAELLGAELDGRDLLMTAGLEQGKSVFQSNVTLLAGQSRTLVLRLSEPRATGRPQLMSPQPLVRSLAQTVRIAPCRTGL